MNEALKSNVKNGNRFESFHQDKMPKQQSYSRFHPEKPTGVIQRMKPKKRNTVSKREIIDRYSKEESEEFDSDQHIENPNDWHDELDVVKMPHLLGPSATKHSPIPADYQHYSIFSAPPFSCQQILIQFTETGPYLFLVPCTYSYHNDYNAQNMY